MKTFRTLDDLELDGVWGGGFEFPWTDIEPMGGDGAYTDEAAMTYIDADPLGFDGWAGSDD